MSNAGSITHHHVVDSEQTGPSPLECIACHDPHLVTSSQPLINPETGARVPQADVPHEAASNPAAAAADTGRFCLICHDGSWPGAANIAAELANPATIRSGFYRENRNLHEEHNGEPRGAPACSYCHNAHGNTGTRGIRRTALLYNWITVNNYPYTEKDSCGTADPLNGCHGSDD